VSFWDGLLDDAKAVGNAFSPTAIIDHVIGGYQNAAPDQSKVGSALSAGVSGSAIDYANKAVSAIPGTDYLLQLPNRAIDTAVNAFDYAGYKGTNSDGSTDGGAVASAVFNTNTWSQAWSSFGQAGHLSAGTIIGQKIFGTNDQLSVTNPFDAKTSQLVQADVHNNWYSDLFGATTDVAAGFVMPVPGVGLVKASRAAKALDASKVEAVTEAVNSGSAVGKATPVADTLKAYVAGESRSSTESLTAQLNTTMSKLDGITDRNSMMNKLVPYMQNSDERLKGIMADTFVAANKMTDPEMRQHVRMNAILAGMGSTGARTELASVAPLIAKQLENVSTTPEAFGLIDQLATLRATPGAEYNISSVLSDHFNTPGMMAERDALKAQLAKDASDAQTARDLVAQQRAFRPGMRTQDPITGSYVDSINVATVKDLRAKATSNVASLTDQLKSAKAEAAGNQRFADASVKPSSPEGIQGAADFNSGLGAAQQRVTDLTDRLAQAKSDHELIHSTPLDDGSLADWKNSMKAAQGTAKDASMSQKWSEAQLRTHNENINSQVAQASALRPALNSANDFLTNLFSIGDADHTMVAGVAPTRLDAIKTAFRESVGESHLYAVSDANTPVWMHYVPTGPQILNAIGTPRARGGLDLLKADQGRLQLIESLKRSGQFAGDEIRQAGNDFISTSPANRQNYVSQIEDTMLTRIAQSHGMTLEQAQAKTKIAKQVYGNGRMFLSKAADEAQDGQAWVGGLDGEHNVMDAAMLKSHMADTAPFVDPSVFHHALRDVEGGIGSKFWTVADHLDQANDFTQRIWKHSVLLRPGLGVRAMLDTELRAFALIGSASQMMEGANALGRITRRQMTPLMEWMGKQPKSEAVAQIMGEKGLDLPIGGSETAHVSAYALGDKAMQNAQRSALSGGSSLSDSLVGARGHIADALEIKRQDWAKYKATSEEWPIMYGEHAQVLVASPTVRALMGEMDKPHILAEGEGPLSPQQYVTELFKNPAVQNEYNSLALGQDISKGDFVHSLLDETQRMFPTSQIAHDVLSGRVSGKAAGSAWIEQNFPKEARFDIPGPSSLLTKDSLGKTVNKLLDTFYQKVLDAPDFWMARHPVYVKTYESTIKSEAKALLDQRMAEDPSAMLGPTDIKMLDSRARTQATSLVRNTFFDTARYTGATHAVSKIAPFFNAWEDAMMSWSRLVYDNPKVAARLEGGYNAAGNASPYMPQPLMVDGNGAAVQPGQATPNGKYIALPFKSFDGTQLRINLSALNSIAQGEVAWLPGFGPVTQTATTAILGDVLPEDMVLNLVDNQNPVVQNLLHSMYLGGQLPKHGTGDILKSVTPSILKNAQNDFFGDNLAANVGDYVNQRYIDAQRNHTPWGPTEQRKAYDDAVNQGRAAGLVHLVAQGILGLSGTASVDGQFYVDQMHQLNALTPDQLKAMGYHNAQDAFSKQFPEAGNLDWRLTKNETGVSATVNAQKSASKYKALIDDHPELGWFVVGADNVGGQFSQTAYGMQRADSYGYAALGRKTDTPGQVERGAIASQGWDQFTKFNASLQEAAKTQALDPTTMAKVKAAFVAWNGNQNPEWFRDYNTRQNKLADFFNEADQMAKSSVIKDRPDVQLYSQYRAIRGEVLQKFGIQSFTGSSSNSESAAAVMANIGQQMASQNIGFSQMWDRALSAEVTK
jgi:hypothetical protein